MSYTIVIGNKNYSSWSMRPWLVLDHFGFDFTEIVVPLDQPETRAEILQYTPAGKVPVLLDGSFVVWDSLAIIEYLAEQNPEKGIWPADPRERARARSLASEMHAGFGPLRSACPMNLRKQFKWKPRGGADAQKNVDRIEALVRDQINRFGGPFLFGDTFGAVDAMYAPVCSRLATYAWPMSELLNAYVDRVLRHKSVARWREAALQESWTIAKDEVR